MHWALWALRSAEVLHSLWSALSLLLTLSFTCFIYLKSMQRVPRVKSAAKLLILMVIKAIPIMSRSKLRSRKPAKSFIRVYRPSSGKSDLCWCCCCCFYRVVHRKVKVKEEKGNRKRESMQTDGWLDGGKKYIPTSAITKCTHRNGRILYCRREWVQVGSVPPSTLLLLTTFEEVHLLYWLLLLSLSHNEEKKNASELVSTTWHSTLTMRCGADYYLKNADWIEWWWW